MKKIIYALVLSMALGTASAQIQMQKHANPITICSGWLGYNKLQQMNNAYYLTLTSDNQFDGPYIIWLGTKDSAIETLSQFLNNYSKDATFNCVDDTKEPFMAFGNNTMGEKRYVIKKKGYGGYAYLRISEIKKFLSALTE